MTPVQAIVGIDTGGTFTDLIAFVGSEVRSHKVPSTPDDPARAVLLGLHEMLPETLPRIVTYGSTVATNTLLERRGARVLLLTTSGFEDLIEIGRQNRPLLYDPEPRPPQPLVPRRWRIGVAERMSFEGRVLKPLTAHAIRSAVRTVRRLKPDAVAVCLLHSYANQRHERQLGAAVADCQVFSTLSHELSAEYREFERFSTTVINAYVGPVMSRHLQKLERGLGAPKLARTRLRVMQSNGGAISARLAGREAVHTVLSGPAGGVIGAWNVARALQLQQVITFDMGGTSTDVSLIDGAVRYRSEWAIDGLPLKVPAIDIHTVGAGGGSVAWIDDGGALKVGPHSAGADPGPACYGTGHLATVTDANVVLGRLLASDFLDGRMRLHGARAHTAVRRVGSPLHLTQEGTAEGIVRVVNASMERAIRTISVERGHDPRQYALIAFGGAAGQHACELAAALGIRRVVVPSHPGLLSAWGAASADVQRDYVRTVLLTDPSTARLRALCRPLERSARADLRAEGLPPALSTVVHTVDVRYRGQSYEIALPLTANLASAFHAAHRELYGYADPARAIEVVTVRVRATGHHPPAPRRRFVAMHSQPAARCRVHWNGRWVQATVHRRRYLAAGTAIRSPALITELSATTFVPPAWRATVHRTGHLVLSHAH